MKLNISGFMADVENMFSWNTQGVLANVKLSYLNME